MKPILSNSSHNLIGQKMFQILAKALELEAKGNDVIHFEIGDPDFPTPENIKKAAIESLLNNETHYTKSSGIDELKNIACEVTSKSRMFRPNLNQVLVTPGANFQIYLALACIANIGDEIVIPNPSFVSYQSIAKFLNLKIVDLPLTFNNSFRILPDDFKRVITKKTKAIIINSPNNPTGSVMKKEDLIEIYNLCEKNNIYLISDEIYSRMIYKDSDVDFYSPASIDQCKKLTVVINGFSKSYAMTGWRLGVVTGPEFLIQKMSLLTETLISCVPIFIQKAGVEALKGPQNEIENMVKVYKKRRDLIYSLLSEIDGFEVIKPDGAFYIFPSVKPLKKTSEEVADEILKECNVAVAPGSIFGSYGEGYIRLCYACSEEKIIQGISRIKQLYG